MEKIELQKKYERLKALITLAQILLVLSAPCFYSISKTHRTSSITMLSGMIFLLSSLVLLSIYRKKIKQKIQKIIIR